MGWSRLQSASNNTFGTSVAATFGTNVSAGSKIIAAVSGSWRLTPTSVKDGASNNLTLLGSSIPASNGGSTWLYAMDTPAGDVGTKPVITATFSDSDGQSIIVQEVSGLLAGNTSAMLDGSAAVIAGGTTTSTGSPSYSSTAANEYLVCIYGNTDNAVTLVAGGGLTLDANNNTNFSYASIEYGNSTGGAETTGFTGAGTAQWSILTAAFKLAVVAGATPQPIVVPSLAAIQAANW